MSVTIDSRLYNMTFYGILNANGAFWTPLAFDSETKAWQHLRDFWRKSDAEWQGHKRHFKVVPVRITLEALPRDSDSGSQSEDAPQSAAEAEGPQSGAAKTAHRPNALSSPSHPESTP